MSRAPYKTPNRLSMMLTSTDDKAIVAIVRRRQCSITDAVRTGLRLMAYLCAQPEDTQFLVRQSDGSEREVVIV